MKTVADNNQPINKISYSQQLSTLQHEGLQKTKQRKNETKPWQHRQTKSMNQPIASVQHLKREINSKNEICTRIKRMRRKLRLFQGGRTESAGAVLRVLRTLWVQFF